MITPTFCLLRLSWWWLIVCNYTLENWTKPIHEACIEVIECLDEAFNEGQSNYWRDPQCWIHNLSTWQGCHNCGTWADACAYVAQDFLTLNSFITVCVYCVYHAFILSAAKESFSMEPANVKYHIFNDCAADWISSIHLDQHDMESHPYHVSTLDKITSFYRGIFMVLRWKAIASKCCSLMWNDSQKYW